MAWLGFTDRETTVRHRMGNLLGNGTVSGEAANLGTALFDPDGSASAIPVTVTEVGTTGYYDQKFTPVLVGIYRLTTTNPDKPPSAVATDQNIVDYFVEVNNGVAADQTLLLTSRSRVLVRLEGLTGNVFTTEGNILIDQLISETSKIGHEYMGRILPQQNYIEYHDGSGASLWLRQGPLVSLLTFERVTSRSGGVEVLEVVEAGTYLLSGLRDEAWRGLGRLRAMEGSTFVGGVRNFKIAYTAGYLNIPESVVSWATETVLSKFFNRETVGQRVKNVADEIREPWTPLDIARNMKMMLDPYKVIAFSWDS